jgi:hypothetical protein
LLVVELSSRFNYKWSQIDFLIFISRFLNDNQLTGEIPSSIGNLVNLQIL